MSATLWNTGDNNAFATTLNGAISDADDSIVLTSVAGLNFPGLLVIDRVDSSDNATPNQREYISYTGISTNTLTGVTRGLGGSNAQEHASGAVIEEVMTVTHWNDLVEFLGVSHDASGNIVISGNASIANIINDEIIVGDRLYASGASIVGNFPITPTWQFEALVSGPSVGPGAHTAMPQPGYWKFFTATLNGPASGATVIIDVNKNGTSIFDDATRIMVPGGGTYVSTASIKTFGFNPGDVFSVDLDQIGNTINDLNAVVSGRG